MAAFLTMKEISTEELIYSDEEIRDMKEVVGSNLTLKVYISPGNESHIAWDDVAQKDVKTKTKAPADWQYDVIRSAFSRINLELGITIKEVFKERESDTQIKLTTVPNADAVNGEWIRSWDDSGVTDIYLSMTYQSGLDGTKYPAAHRNPDAFPHNETEQSTWKKIFIHELGHLLGLEHPWDQDDGDWAVSSSEEPTISTIMGYESYDLNGNIMDWFQEIDSKALREIWGTADSQIITDNAEAKLINKPSKFNKKFVDKITSFNSTTDTLEIDSDSFGIDSSATFATGKNKKIVKKKLAKQDFDFLYDEKKGGLYFNENGSDKGFGDGGIIAILKGAPDLTSDNLEFI